MNPSAPLLLTASLASHDEPDAGHPLLFVDAADVDTTTPPADLR